METCLRKCHQTNKNCEYFAMSQKIKLFPQCLFTQCQRRLCIKPLLPPSLSPCPRCGRGRGVKAGISVVLPFSHCGRFTILREGKRGERKAKVQLTRSLSNRARRKRGKDELCVFNVRNGRTRKYDSLIWICCEKFPISKVPSFQFRYFHFMIQIIKSVFNSATYIHDGAEPHQPPFLKCTFLTGAKI